MFLKPVTTTANNMKNQERMLYEALNDLVNVIQNIVDTYPSEKDKAWIADLPTYYKTQPAFDNAKEVLKNYES